MTDKTAKSDGKRGLTGKPHFHPVFARPVHARQLSSSQSLFQRLTSLLFPWHVLDYPGRNAALGEALGYSTGTIEEAGKGRLSVPRLMRAGNFCRSLASELLAIADECDREAAILALTKAPKRRGMLEVRVRDETGIPRNAVWRGGRSFMNKDKSKPF